MDDIRIPRKTAHDLVTNGARLIDVRSPEEFASGALPGAINVPVQAVAQQIQAHAQPGDTIVLYCKSGARSDVAARLLRQAGYAKSYNLGGIGEW
jgi:phage shock protein E